MCICQFLWDPELCPVASVTKSLRSVVIWGAELYKRVNIGGGSGGVCMQLYNKELDPRHLRIIYVIVRENTMGQK